MTARRSSPEPESKPAPAEDAAAGSPERLAEVEAELAKVNATYLRLAADFENHRRRKAQEREELIRYGSVGLLQALLPGLDSLARAVSHIPAEAKDGLAEGLRLTLKQLEDALGSQGIRRIESVGVPFNPRLHDAVLTVPAGEAEPGTVVAELAPGYQIHDRVVRPAQVSVAEAEEVPSPSGAAVLEEEPTGPGSEPAERSPN
ncbi:MAG TPA: nucleotide exchange factor GrpE [Candidatus Dormibacteraeota bacterium]